MVELRSIQLAIKTFLKYVAVMRILLSQLLRIFFSSSKTIIQVPQGIKSTFSKMSNFEDRFYPSTLKKKRLINFRLDVQHFYTLILSQKVRLAAHSEELLRYNTGGVPKGLDRFSDDLYSLVQNPR